MQGFERIRLTDPSDKYTPSVIAEADFVVAENGRVIKDRYGVANRQATPEEIAGCVVLSAERASQLRFASAPRGERGIACPGAEGVPGGWQGEIPAQGTRRRTILDAIRRHRMFRTVGAAADEAALGLADEVEEALLATEEPGEAPHLLHVCENVVEIPELGLRVGTYPSWSPEREEEPAYRGWVEPGDKKWLVFLRADGGIEAHHSRSASGAVLDEADTAAEEGNVPPGTREIHVVTASVPDRVEPLLDLTRMLIGIGAHVQQQEAEREVEEEEQQAREDEMERIRRESRPLITRLLEELRDRLRR